MADNDDANNRAIPMNRSHIIGLVIIGKWKHESGLSNTRLQYSICSYDNRMSPIT